MVLASSRRRGVVGTGQEERVRRNLTSQYRRGGSLAARRRRRLVDDAVSYVEARGDWRVSVTELCQALDVGRRTLEYAFQHIVDASPRAFFVRRALEAAHSELESTAPGRRTVTEVATDHGFWHLGRFAVTYRTAYGQSPSETLRGAAVT
jgi:AraC family ethanolamine operon transcriptional activator